MPADKTEPTKLDVVILGAGVGGLYAVYRLRKLGLKVRAYEAASGIGGTWFWNRYPGCRCDVESMEYSYSFSNELQQEWQWPERYGTQPEILRHVDHVAGSLRSQRDIQLNTRIRSAAFNSKINAWTLKTDTGEVITAPFCIMATGNLSTPRTPSVPGLKTFKGKWYHTGLWPHEGVDFTGLRVGVIGTGSSGVQMIPHVARQAKHLFVFQRTANFSLPARNAPLDPEKERKHKAEYPERRRAAYETPFGIAGYPPPEKVGARSGGGRAAANVCGKMGGGRQHQLSLCLQRPPGEQGLQRYGFGLRAREDPRHRQGPSDGGAALPQ